MMRIVHLNRWPWLTLVLTVMVMLVHAWPGAADALALDRAAVADGELWRLVTGHLTHWSLAHLGWDLLAFAALGVFAERAGRVRLAATLILATAAISAWVWVGEPGLISYRGLSGIDSALFVLVAAGLLRRAAAERNASLGLLAGAALTAFIGRSLCEVALGQPLFVSSDIFVPVPAAHLMGGLIGAAAALCPTFRAGSTVPASATGLSMLDSKCV